MPRIQTLPEHVISRIAAGEVIERPVYAVKELIENSLDAGADSITIQIERGGLKKIMITDDGEGMTKDDLFESFKPHTTSKLQDESLIGIKTLGFRGEALASIAAISDMVLQSRVPGSAAGVQVILKSGTVIKSGPVGMPVGTSISVQNLFHTVPARKKFLRSERTEFRHILDLVIKYALSYPTKRFLLLHNNRIIIDLPKNQDISQRLSTLLGDRIAQQLIPISASDDYLKLQGFIARPQVSVQSGDKQYLYINNRSVSDRGITRVVKEAFGNLLENTRFPVYVMSIEIPHEAVDVNVHPRKEQVSFVNNDMVYEVVKSSVSNSLASHNLTYLSSLYSTTRVSATNTPAALMLREKTEKWNVKDSLKIINTDQIQQVDKTFLIAQTKNGVLMVDQHAAHERILYEQYLETYKELKLKQDKFKLHAPIDLDLSLSDKEVVEEYLDLFASNGFEIRKNGSSFILLSVHKLFMDQDYNQLIQELLGDIREMGKIKDLELFINTIISYLACRNAIKAGDVLTQDEARRLIEKLDNTNRNSNCPHGRPTAVEISLKDLYRLFKRG